MMSIEWPGVTQNLFRSSVCSVPTLQTMSSTGGFWNGLNFGFSSFLEPESPDLGFLARVGE